MISFEQLADYIDGRLTPTEVAEVEALLREETDETHATVAWLQKFAAARQYVQLPAPPEHVRVKAMTQFDKKFSAAPSASLMQQIFAVLAFDSWADGNTVAPQGVRSAGLISTVSAPPFPRQIICATPPYDIVFSLNATMDNQTILMGQVLPNEEFLPLSFDVRLRQYGRPVSVTNCDELGEFLFAKVPSGHCDLLFNTENLQIVSPIFEV